MYLSAPLPFMGQKRMFAREYIKVLEGFKDARVFVDLFGGSGLLSHITKCKRPDAEVVYNDFDNYRRRLDNIPRTNALLADLREIAKDVPRGKAIKGGAGADIGTYIDCGKGKRVRGLHHPVVVAYVFDEV